MAVYFKFKSAKDFDSIPIEGQFISLVNLKERIFESKHLGRGTDFDLMVSNAQTNEEYVDEAAMIPKNTSVLIRRIPGRPRKPIVTQPDEPKDFEDKVEDIPLASSKIGDSSANKFVNHEEYEWDEFGNDLYAMPEVLPAQPSIPAVDMTPADNVDEDSKIKALIETPALDWSRQPQDGFISGRGFGRGMGGRMMGGRGFGRGGLERKTPPPGYVCHRCKVPGHFIQHCPTNGDPNYDIKRVKPPTGIPKSMLIATPDGSYALPSGAVAVLKPNEAAFEKEIEGLPTTRTITDVPPELRCPLCKQVMKDAVLTSKCCFSSFCDKYDLLPNKTLRETISRMMETATSSAENGGSLVQVPDMESARHVQPRAPSPTLSAASKDERKHAPLVDPAPEVKQSEATSEGNLNALMEKKAIERADTPGTANSKEPAPQESAPAPEEVVEKIAGEPVKKKKKKKARAPGNAGDMQWRGFQDLGGENFTGMPPFNPYWTGGMPLGMDTYMGPFAGPMPFMGYTPGPFDVPFGGLLPQDPFAAQNYMMPVVPPRNLPEFGMNSMVMNQGPPGMSREGLEARKANARRKQEIERHSERDHYRDRVPAREVSSMDVPPTKAKPRPTSQSAGGVVDRSERSDRAERQHPESFREHSARESRRHSSPRPLPPPRSEKRRPTESTAEASAATVTGLSKADKKHKSSVFSRISFPEASSAAAATAGDGGSRKRKSSSEMVNGVKDHHESHRHRGGVTSANANGYREEKRVASSAAYDDSSEEEYHFKRRPSSSRREAEWDDDGRQRSSREHDRKRR